MAACRPSACSPKLRFLRGTALDPFGHTAERKRERALIGDYRDLLQKLLPALTADNHAIAVALARLPEKIRGYGHVKEANLAVVAVEQRKLLDAFNAPPSPHAIAAE